MRVFSGNPTFTLMQHILLIQLTLYMSITPITNAISVPISASNGTSIKNALPFRNDSSLDTSRRTSNITTTSNANELTNNTTLSIMNQINPNDHSSEHSGHDPSELDQHSEYFSQQEKLMTNMSDGYDDEKNGDLTKVLDGFVLLNNLYDTLVRPGQYDGDGPTNVTVQIFLQPWFEMNEPKNEMTLTLTLVQNWTDSRLAYESRLSNPEKLPYVTLTGQMQLAEIWHPDTFILSEKRSYKHDVTVANELVRISSKGQVSKEQRLTVTLNCPFYLNEKFPFDYPNCFLNITSFSWDKSHLQYHWPVKTEAQGSLGLTIVQNSNDPGTESLVSASANGFQINNLEISDNLVDRSDQQMEKSFGLVVKIELKRNASLYLTKLFLPLASFCLISIIGLHASIGPQMGCALSYFMFGLMSIFMAISFNGPDFNWGYGRTVLDSYYVISVMTVMLTGIVNIFKLGQESTGRCEVETYEMHRNAPSQENSSNTSRISNRRENPLDSSMDEEIDDEVRNGRGTVSFIKFIKSLMEKGKRKCALFCMRMSSYATLFLLGLFISWNLHFFVKHFTGFGENTLKVTRLEN